MDQVQEYLNLYGLLGLIPRSGSKARRRQSEVLSAQLREAQAKLDQAKAALDGAEVDLDKTTVNGAILKVNVRLGEYAQAGVFSNPLMTIGSIDPLHVRVDIDEAKSWHIRRDDNRLTPPKREETLGSAKTTAYA